MEEAIFARLEAIEEKLDDIKKQLRRDFVLRVEFRPVRNLVYGAAGMILMFVLGALLRAAT